MLLRCFRSSLCIKFDNATTVRLGDAIDFRFGVPMNSERNIAVVGLGYVGLPLAVALSKNFPVIGYDRDSQRIAQLREGFDRTNEFERQTLEAASIRYSDDSADLRNADIYIVAVPTPVDASNQPDLTALSGATELVGGVVQKG